MKIVTLLLSAALLAACGPSTSQSARQPREVCTGKLEKFDGRHLRMSCEDGRVINYTSYKYDMTEK